MVLLDIYEDTAGEQRFRLVSTKGKVLSESSTGHSGQKALCSVIKRLFDDIRSNRIKVRVNGKAADLSVLD